MKVLDARNPDQVSSATAIDVDLGDNRRMIVASGIAHVDLATPTTSEDTQVKLGVHAMAVQQASSLVGLAAVGNGGSGFAFAADLARVDRDPETGELSLFVHAGLAGDQSRLERFAYQVVATVQTTLWSGGQEQWTVIATGTEGTTEATTAPATPGSAAKAEEGPATATGAGEVVATTGTEGTEGLVPDRGPDPLAGIPGYDPTGGHLTTTVYVTSVTGTITWATGAMNPGSTDPATVAPYLTVTGHARTMTPAIGKWAATEQLTPLAIGRITGLSVGPEECRATYEIRDLPMHRPLKVGVAVGLGFVTSGSIRVERTSGPEVFDLNYVHLSEVVDFILVQYGLY